VNAIYPEEDVPEDQKHFIELNAELAALPNWKNITKSKPAPPDAEEWKDVKDKFQYLERE
jgi:ferredoxin